MTREVKSNCEAASSEAQTESTTEKFDYAQDDTFGVQQDVVGTKILKRITALQKERRSNKKYEKNNKFYSRS